MEKSLYSKYIKLLNQEMVKALGCTEPSAVAFAGAEAREILGEMPEKVIIKCSQNIIKNAKCVSIPNTNGMIGIDSACLLGCIVGNSGLGLELLKNVKESDIEKLKELKEKGICKVESLNSGDNLHIICYVESAAHNAEVEILYSHSNIVSAKKDGKVIIEDRQDIRYELLDPIFLKFDDIYEFTQTFKINDLKPLLDSEIRYNLAIANEGLKHDYGANVGKTILKNANGDIKEIAKAYAAAGSDARMSGCSMPVIISYGSGNQGITILLSIYQYAKHLKVSDEILYRALVFGNLLALWQKARIGTLSAFCGAVSSGSAAGAAITYMRNGSKKQIADTVINALNSAGGIICDGAKPSCALKIALSVECGITASNMALDNNVFKSGEGLVKDDLEKTVEAVCKMAKDGMEQTDKVILELMLE